MIDRAYGCLIGAAIGDAMGMPASFMSPEKIKKVYGRIDNFFPPAEEQTAHNALEQGEITDDTEEALIISSVLIEANGFQESLFVTKMKEWALKNKMLESTVIGPNTRAFLEAIIQGKDYFQCGCCGDTNGSAMRVAPLGIFYHGNVEQTIKEAMASARPSHGSRPAMAATAAIAAAISLAIEGNSNPEQIIQAAMKGARAGEELGFDIPAPSVYRRIELAKDLVDSNQQMNLEQQCFLLYQYIGAGMKSYESIPLTLGIFYAARGNFEAGLLEAINIGDDADTNGGIVGALCGAYSGAQSIRSDWIEHILQSNQGIDFQRIAAQLLQQKV
ncbi:MAG: ADP-ribosylglycohydrolase family protein [Spirochaetota bacterium]